MGNGSPKEPLPIPEVKSLQRSGFSEESERAFYSHWQRLMMQG
jgi:hypothetical protein